ncbi:FecR family protein [Pseudomonas rubra]|uniref:FecR domain-containing protein n=1 Tax=Pseudomonas rubra TaxID=2942627 RepID=A0ABT5PEM3_9PSED|nr:FecR domain-containing protein [Pseudomonas rubra]MDD1016399.1 FecR domain-containing protein [Pseudomonas rubra]MDD1036528.1 FecR domain-containing protein [Pseudomonas rubra]MDD1156560.1 FecR domain-containing protein [Pseudomonas rubra]
MSPSPSAAVLREAAQWLVRLDDEPSAAEQQAFSAWLAEADEHRDAVQRLQGSLAPLRELPRAPARAALQRVTAAQPGKRALKALAISLALVLPSAALLQHYPPAYLLADLRTGSGQWRSEQLPDGSRISLDGRSAVDLQFDAHSRTLHLVSGEILVQVAKDAERPFRVVTEHGSIRALGTRFVVERLGDSTRLMMIESSTEVRSGASTLTVHAGQQVQFGASGLQAVQPVDAPGLEQAWGRQQMLVREQPLSEVLERLSRNHQGYLLYDAKALAHLKVTAVLPVDDSQRALRLLARSFPIRVEQYTPWLTRVVLE